MSKGAQTRAAILDEAMRVASTDGLKGLSIGSLAQALEMSKSGLFAHFGSKEALHQSLIEEAARRFTDAVWRPALAQPAGLPRIAAVFRNWLDWIDTDAAPGGCLLMTATTELDDKPGPLRDLLVAQFARARQALAHAAELAVREGHLRAGLDARQFAFELDGIVLGFNFARRLLRDPMARARADAAFRDLIARSQN